MQRSPTPSGADLARLTMSEAAKRAAVLRLQSPTNAPFIEEGQVEWNSERLAESRNDGPLIRETHGGVSGCPCWMACG
jgi:hypothetical protein